MRSALGQLRLPIIVAPMFLASGLALVSAARAAGLVGSFPIANARDPETLGIWLDTLNHSSAGAAYAVNIVLAERPGSAALQEACLARRPPVLITSNGDPTPIIEAARAWGGLVLHDATSLRHARKAIDAGVHGVILVCAGAGGHTGAVSPFALLREVRMGFDGLVVLGGAIGDGASILAAQAMGADLVLMGTRFLASEEADIAPEHKAMMIAATTGDVVRTPAISGLPANFLSASIRKAGLDLDKLVPPKGPQRPDLPRGLKAWRDIWSAGQGVGTICDAPPVAKVVDRLADEYAAAREAMAARLGLFGEDPAHG